MPKYLADRPSFINGQYYYATVREPAVLDLPPEVEPSRTFKPLDEAAVKALHKLGVKNAQLLKSTPAAAVAAKSTDDAKRQSDRDVV